MVLIQEQVFAINHLLAIMDISRILILYLSQRSCDLILQGQTPAQPTANMYILDHADVTF